MKKVYVIKLYDGDCEHDLGNINEERGIEECLMSDHFRNFGSDDWYEEVEAEEKICNYCFILKSNFNECQKMCDDCVEVELDKVGL